MEAEHELIDPILESIRSALVTQASRIGDELSRHDLADLIDQAATVLDDHLSHEEKDAIAILQKHVGGDEWADLERRKFRGGLKPRVLLSLLPWVTEGAPVGAVAPLMAEAGAPFRVMLKMGRSRFQKLQRAAFKYVPAGTRV